MAQLSRVLTLVLSTACLFLAQQAPPSVSPTFSSESDLVLLPFNVERDSKFVTDLEQGDIELLQDGKPRDFSVFESPRTRGRTPVELIILFDTTTFTEAESKARHYLSGWNREATYRWVGRWTDAESLTLLEKQAAEVRVAVYRFDRAQLQRLCRPTSDPQALTAAIHRLPEQIPPEEAIPLSLPPGRVTFEETMAKRGVKPDPKHPIVIGTPSWSFEAVIGVLRDLEASPSKTVRLLADFSQGKGPTTTMPEDIAAQDSALQIPIYPIALVDMGNGPSVQGEAPPGGGIHGCDAKSLPMGYTCQVLGPPTFGNLGPLTGGRAFYPRGIDEHVVSNILEVTRNEGLLRYVLGFVPPPSAKPRKHDLEIRLKSKSTGKLIGGRRAAVY
jgi:hypothetical protein